MASFDYDVAIIGSGFGGSVAALRAAEKGYRVGVMETSWRPAWTRHPACSASSGTRTDREEMTMTELVTEAFRTIGRDDAVPSDLVVPHYLDDRKRRISVARVGGRLYASDDLCTCGGTPCALSGGLLEQGTLMCRCHGSRFDSATGAVLAGPASAPLNRCAVPEVDGEIQVRLS